LMLRLKFINYALAVFLSMIQTSRAPWTVAPHAGAWIET